MQGMGREQLARHLERLRAYMPSRIQNRLPGAYPAIDQFGPPAEQLADAAVLRGGFFQPEDWQGYAGSALATAQKVLGEEVGDFNRDCAANGAARMARFGSFDPRGQEVMEIINLYGTNVGRDGANDAWLTGYACALGRLMQSGLRPVQELTGSDLAAAGHELFRHPFELWLEFDSNAPLPAEVVLECIEYATDETFKRLYPLFGDESEQAARVRLRALAIKGFGLGRLQLERSFVQFAAGLR
jgi:hypothetical protein